MPVSVYTSDDVFADSNQKLKIQCQNHNLGTERAGFEGRFIIVGNFNLTNLSMSNSHFYGQDQSIQHQSFPCENTRFCVSLCGKEAVFFVRIRVVNA